MRSRQRTFNFYHLQSSLFPLLIAALSLAPSLGANAGQHYGSDEVQLRGSSIHDTSLSTSGFGLNASVPTIKLRQGTLVGISDGSSESFLGVRYAQPPLGPLRWARPLPPKPDPHGVYDATQFGDICNQPPGAGIVNTSEDCLYANIYRPAGTKPGTKLPVMVWVHGGGFFAGRSNQFDGTPLVQASQNASEPVILVTFNYRLGAFGFLASSEFRPAQDAGDVVVNAGFHDMRAAFKWVHDNAPQLGGDPDRITAFGESAGAIGLGANLIAKGGSISSISGAILESGGPQITIFPASHPSVEERFRTFVEMVGCGDSTAAMADAMTTATQKHRDLLAAAFLGRAAPALLEGDHNICTIPSSSSLNPSRLACLRAAPQDTLAAASNAIFLNSSAANANSTNYVPGYFPWLPVFDDFFYEDLPSRRLAEGKVADIPIISGDNADEGTLFAPQNLNNSQDFVEWFRTISFVHNDSSKADNVQSGILTHYPNIPALGEPGYYANPAPNATGSAVASFDPSDRYFPGSDNQFKRAAAFFGDWRYENGRRVLLKAASKKERGTSSDKDDHRIGTRRKNWDKVWSYAFRQVDDGIPPYFGAMHGAELGYVWQSRALAPNYVDSLSRIMSRAWISFAAYRDPRKLDDLDWPVYDSDAKQLIQFRADNVTVVRDTYRQEAMAFLDRVDVREVLSR